MSRTITMFSCDSSNSASPMTFRTSCSYPRVSQASERATRSGVLRRPGRSGSSPSSSSCRRTSCASSSIASGASRPSISSRVFIRSRSAVLDIIVLRLPKYQTDEPRGSDRRLENLPERDDDVFRGRYLAAHEMYVEVEIPMIHCAEDFANDQLLQLAQVHHVAGALVNRALYGHVENVVVTVPVGIVAFAERRLVFGVAERWVVDAVGRVEPQPAGYRDACHRWRSGWRSKSSAVTHQRRRSLSLERRVFLKPGRIYEALTRAYRLPRTGA